MPVKPTCGAQGTTGDDNLTAVLAILGILGGLASVIGILSTAGIKTIIGITAASGIWAAAALAALATIVYISYSFYQNCIKDYDGINPSCTTGVINDIVPSFNSLTDYAYPFMAMHPRIDLVVKPIYWDTLKDNADFIYCNDDADTSPMIYTFYHSSKVCAAGLGSAIGAVVGGAGGIIAGVVIAALICASLVLSILCILALLIAAAIAVTGVLAGAELGGLVALALAGNDDPTDSDGDELHRGNYVSVKGNLVLNGNFNNARVYWFAKPEDTSLYGSSAGTAPYSFTDPEANIPEDMDICKMIIIT